MTSVFKIGKRDGAWFAFQVSQDCFTRVCFAALPPFSGSWVVSNREKNGRLNSVPKPKSLPMSTSKTLGDDMDDERLKEFFDKYGKLIRSKYLHISDTDIHWCHGY